MGMQVVATVGRNEALEKRIQSEFPTVQFTFLKKMKEIGENRYTAEILVTYGEDLDEKLINEMKNLRWIMVMSAGIEKLPLDAIKKNHIIVTNARGIHKIPMAEFVFGYILQYAKQLPLFKKQQSEKVWNRKVHLQEIYGKTMLVVGAGAIGSQISRYGKTFGMHTIGINRSGKENPDFDATYSLEQLNHILPEADYVISVLPNTVSTNKIFSRQQFFKMKKEAVFINIGRGNAVDEQALMEALEEGQLAHAFLDVFEKEPLPADHPFWKSDKVTITPHLSAISDMYLPRAYEIFVKNLWNYVNKENNWINLVDLNRGY
jgi:phosphoglycerate dehydrogenase-like enzyme